jgi:hypothetical protein
MPQGSCGKILIIITHPAADCLPEFAGFFNSFGAHAGLYIRY